MGVRLLRRHPRAVAVAVHQASLDRRREDPGEGRLRGRRATTSPTSTRSPSRHFVYGHGRIVRFLAKVEVLDVPVIGRIIRATGQIPVYRMTTDASQAFRAAVAAVEEGKCVAVYPEGTLTRQPELWPMVGQDRRRPHRARLGCPGDPDRAVGAAGHPLAVRRLAAAVPAQDRRAQGRGPGGPRRPARPAAHPGGAPGGDQPDHGRHHRARWRRSAASRHPPYASTHGQPASSRSATPTGTQKRRRRRSPRTGDR